MPQLRYRAIRRSGAREVGTIDAATLDAATEALRARGLVVLDLSDRTQSFLSAGRIRSGDLAELTRALAALLSTGLPLPRALAVAHDIAPPALRSALMDVQTRLEGGSTFADALGEHPHAFPPSYVGLVRAGERAGRLETAVARLAEAIEGEQQFRARLLTAAIYPSLLAVVGGAAILVLLLVVLPRFGALLGSSGSTLPRSTATVLALSTALRAHVLLLAVGAGLAAALGLWLAGAREAAGVRSRLLLSTPVVSRFYREVLAARTARTVAILLDGGAPVVSALEDAARSLDDTAARAEVQRVRARVREGSSIAAAMSEGSLFPPLFARLVAAGEESGQLASFFGRAAELFEERAKRSAARFVALAEPALIVAFGVVVGLIALALVQAIYGINLAPVRTR